MNNAAILIGCQYYSDSRLSKLNGVNNDVSIMQETLTNYCGCKPSDVVAITSEDVTGKEPSGHTILNIIGKIAEKNASNEINNLFFYYSGHGAYIHEQLYLIPSDSIVSVLFGMISLEQLKKALDEFNIVKHIIVILDICQNDCISKELSSDNVSDIYKTFTKSTIFFFSCSPHQCSYMFPPESAFGECSVYTYFLANAMKSSKLHSTVKDITKSVKEQMDDYCKKNSIQQNPHTEAFDIALADVVVSNNQESSYSVKEGGEPLNTVNSIWLIDAEKAKGEESRFKTFTETDLVRQYLDKKSQFLGIASVKGIGKTFLLQVRRVKMSSYAQCFPNVKANYDTNWATECIKFTNAMRVEQAAHDYIEIKLLWKYSLVCYVLQCWLQKQESLTDKKRNASYCKISKWIESEYQNGNVSSLTYNYLRDISYNKLQLIMENTLSIKNWSSMIANEYMFLQRLGRLVTTANSSSNKKTLALFVDKIDQAMREPNSESPLSCDQCSKENSVSICSNSKKSHSYCSQEGEGSCPGRVRCCYGCENYSDNYAGHYSRIDENAPLSKAHYNYWQQLQLALIEAAVDIRDDFNGLIKVMYSVRLEACNYSENVWGEQRAKIMSSVCILSYSRDELKKIYRECIEHQKKELLYFPELADKANKEDLAFVGVNQLCHPHVEGAYESIFDVIYRHSFGRTRDIQDYGQAITSKLHEIKTCSADISRGVKVKEIIEETAARLAFSTEEATKTSENSYYYEKIPIMPSYWADPMNFKALLQCIDRNVLLEDDIRKICANINELGKCPGTSCSLCKHHPFSTLKNLGMLGYLILQDGDGLYSIQRFVEAKHITYFHDLDNLNVNKKALYLIHPALTKSIEKLKNNSKIMHFKGFIIGSDIQVRNDLLKQIFCDRTVLSKGAFENKYYN
jgi:hypothetical protein